MGPATLGRLAQYLALPEEETSRVLACHEAYVRTLGAFCRDWNQRLESDTQRLRGSTEPALFDPQLRASLDEAEGRRIDNLAAQLAQGVDVFAGDPAYRVQLHTLQGVRNAALVERERALRHAFCGAVAAALELDHELRSRIAARTAVDGLGEARLSQVDFRYGLPAAWFDQYRAVRIAWDATGPLGEAGTISLLLRDPPARDDSVLPFDELHASVVHNDAQAAAEIDRLLRTRMKPPRYDEYESVGRHTAEMERIATGIVRIRWNGALETHRILSELGVESGAPDAADVWMDSFCSRMFPAAYVDDGISVAMTGLRAGAESAEERLHALAELEAAYVKDRRELRRRLCGLLIEVPFYEVRERTPASHPVVAPLYIEAASRRQRLLEEIRELVPADEFEEYCGPLLRGSSR